MTREKIREKLNRVFCDVFDDETIHIKDATTAIDIEGWDSLRHIGLILAVEAEFNIKFSVNEMEELYIVGEMIDTIENKIKP